MCGNRIVEPYGGIGQIEIHSSELGTSEVRDFAERGKLFQSFTMFHMSQSLAHCQCDYFGEESRQIHVWILCSTSAHMPVLRITFSVTVSSKSVSQQCLARLSHRN